MNKPFIGALKDWGIIWCKPPTITSPFYCVVGSEVQNAQMVRTSRIVAIREDATGNLMLETKNSFYQLVGEPDHAAACRTFDTGYNSIWRA